MRTLWYRYKLLNGTWVGAYQTDREDFKKLWDRICEDVERCYVWRENGTEENPEQPTVWCWDRTYFARQWIECLGGFDALLKRF